MSKKIEDDNTTTTPHSIPTLQQVADESKNKLDDKQYAAYESLIEFEHRIRANLEQPTLDRWAQKQKGHYCYCSGSGRARDTE